ncbi:hypothetical protein [Bradyrhizobium sp. SZCCHNR1051]|uniref:hypothetical protein n=1 Tax=Bradyrhizobium sp. SZCCHNR1051 TaxID=3057355 RepID=UPI00291671B2|nr:hypothetical protein [Bradyrhizobium sp. SZCCHNR1051]
MSDSLFNHRCATVPGWGTLAEIFAEQADGHRGHREKIRHSRNISFAFPEIVL